MGQGTLQVEEGSTDSVLLYFLLDTCLCLHRWEQHGSQTEDRGSTDTMPMPLVTWLHSRQASCSPLPPKTTSPEHGADIAPTIFTRRCPGPEKVTIYLSELSRRAHEQKGV
jgi:hypothetical protein